MQEIVQTLDFLSQQHVVRFEEINDSLHSISNQMALYNQQVNNLGNSQGLLSQGINRGMVHSTTVDDLGD